MTSPGLTAKGLPMPQTISEWKYLASLYETGLNIEKKKNNVLIIENNKLKQKVERLKMTAKGDK